MQKLRTQKSVVEKMISGFRLYSSYPYSGGRFSCRVERGDMFYNIPENVFRAMLSKNIVGNEIEKTNREYEYFLLSGGKELEITL